MRGGLAGAVAAAAALYVMAPQRRTKCSPWAPAEARVATKDVLRRLSLDCRRSAVVASLWAERPAKQCAVAPRYELTADSADFGGVLRFAAIPPAAATPKGAQALLTRLQAAGYALTETPKAAAVAAPAAARRVA